MKTPLPLLALLPLPLLGLASCATLPEPAGGDQNLPNASAGPFRALSDAVQVIGDGGLVLGSEIGNSRSAPNGLDDSRDYGRDIAVVDADGDPSTLEVVAYVAAAVTMNGMDPTPTTPTRSLVRYGALDGRSFDYSAEVVLTPDAAWEGGLLASPAAVRAGGEILLYYAAAGGIGLAKSADGHAFTKLAAPVLAPVPGGWEQGAVPASPGVVVLADGSFRMFYEVTTGTGAAPSATSIGEASSPDGATWTRLGTAPALAPTGPGDNPGTSWDCSVGRLALPPARHLGRRTRHPAPLLRSPRRHGRPDHRPGGALRHRRAVRAGGEPGVRHRQHARAPGAVRGRLRRLHAALRDGELEHLGHAPGRRRRRRARHRGAPRAGADVTLPVPPSLPAPQPAPAKPRHRWRRAPTTTEDEVRVVGAPRVPFRDVYHAYLRARWPVALGVLVAFYLALNACFALAYLVFGGVHDARPGSFADAFYFSVQTMGTIGYGAMYPVSRAANLLVVAESVTGLVVTAVATGLIFAKFSLSTSRIVFARRAVIGMMDGVPTLMIRLGNERSNRIIEATVRLAMVRTERTREGMLFYRMVDLPLSRERSPALSRSWTALHPITPASPLYRETPASLHAGEVELFVTVSGVDDTSLQPVHARHKYTDEAIVWGARHADVLSEEEGGVLVLDLRKFHDLTITERTAEFPYPE